HLTDHRQVRRSRWPRRIRGFAVARRRLRQCLRRILEKREVQGRRHPFHLWRLQRSFWIVDGAEYALLDLTVAFPDVILLRLEQSAELFHIRLNGVSNVGELEWQQVRIGETNDQRSANLCE